MIPLLVTPDLRLSCRYCFPYAPPLEPYLVVVTSTELWAYYECPCGPEWSATWDGSPWPVAEKRAA